LTIVDKSSKFQISLIIRFNTI